MPDYLPSSYPSRLAWSTNFSTKFGANPTSFGGTAAQATQYTALHTTFVAAQAAADDPSTKTSSAVLARDIAWDACEQLARELAAIIQATPTVTPVQKNDLGLTVRDTTRSPIGPPTTKPVVNIERIMNLAHLLRIRDEATRRATPARRDRPAGKSGPRSAPRTKANR
jgi:hypothetical protein